MEDTTQMILSACTVALFDRDTRVLVVGVDAKHANTLRRIIYLTKAVSAPKEKWRTEGDTLHMRNGSTVRFCGFEQYKDLPPCDQYDEVFFSWEVHKLVHEENRRLRDMLDTAKRLIKLHEGK